MSKTNGNGTELVENVDYFEMKDGIWLTIEGVSKKYGIANTTVSWKGNQFNIPKKKIAGSLCYKDSNEFEYKRANAETAKHLPKNPTYSELVLRLKDYTDSTDSLIKEVTCMHQELLEKDHKLDEMNSKLDLILEVLSKQSNDKAGSL